MTSLTRKVKLKKKVLLLAALTIWFGVPALRADDTSANISIGKMITNLKISGDMRIRQEFFWNTSNSNTQVLFPTASRPDPYTADRSRQRVRLRLGITPQIQDITLFIRLVTGTGEQVSTNQSFDNSFTLKKVWFDQVAMQWKAFEWLRLTGGKMPNPMWRTYASDIVWDDDTSPEGFSEQFDKQLGERFGFFANFGQFALDEDGASNYDQWMLANQLGLRTKIMEETKLTVAGNFNYYKDEARSDWGHVVTVGAAGTALPDVPGGAVQLGNTRVNATTGQLASSFTTVGVTAELATRFWKWPLLLHGDYIINEQDNSNLAKTVSGGDPGEAKIGYQVGFQLGKAATQYSWELAYYYKYLENNATPADLADSDFGNGGTNRKGHIIWLSFAPRDYITLRAKVFVTELIDTAYNIPGGASGAQGFGNSINRMQLDCQVKF